MQNKIIKLVTGVIVACFALLGYVIYLIAYGHQSTPEI